DRARTLYRTGDGDPIYVADANGNNPKRIFLDKPSDHNHYPTWSPDGRLIYFARGVPLQDMDFWRIPSAGGAAERLTHHRSVVAYPTFIDERTLLYTATRPGGRMGLYAMEVERRIPHAVSSGVEQYVSIAGSADGRRLVATVANPI